MMSPRLKPESTDQQRKTKEDCSPGGRALKTSNVEEVPEKVGIRILTDGILYIELLLTYVPVVIVYENDHLGVAAGYRLPSGEAIFATSSYRALEASGYTVLYYGEDADLVRLVDTEVGNWDIVKAVIMKDEAIASCSKNATCIFSVRNKKGIPLYKMLSFWFWPYPPTHPLGANWALGPEPYAYRKIRPNVYLGYSVEESCAEVSYLEPSIRYGYQSKTHALLKANALQGGLRQLRRFQKEQKVEKSRLLTANSHRRALWILGKRNMFLTKNWIKWDEEQFAAAYWRTSARYELGSTDDRGKNGEIITAPPFFKDPQLFYNHSQIPVPYFKHILSTMSLIIGIGAPTTSPTPYETLCLGIPFLNPVTWWDAGDPFNRSKWKVQHEGLIDVPEPYVYHVFQNVTTSFVMAVEKALKTPIKRYTLPEMKQDAINRRMRTILARDLEQMANSYNAISVT